jgi:hypothetical protein
MEIETFTCIEVTNEPHIWAIDLFQCKKMGPVVPEFVLVGNGYNQRKSGRLCRSIQVDTKPEKNNKWG